MGESKKPELISFNLCPYVQRSVITLLKKGVDFDITYIDLSDKPDWFLKISPLGKVPVLKVGDIVLFESAVINEYLDEITPPSFHPTDPLEKARHRAWIEFGSTLLISQYHFFRAEDEEIFNEKKEEILNKLQSLEQQLGEGTYFSGSRFSLVDAAFAPSFTRMAVIAKYLPVDIFQNTPKVASWSRVLVNDPEVKKSVVDNFEELNIKYLKESGGYIAKYLPKVEV